MNVSQEEFAKMLNVYQKSVQQAKILSRLQELTSNLDRSITNHLPETFKFSPTCKHIYHIENSTFLSKKFVQAQRNL